MAAAFSRVADLGHLSFGDRPTGYWEARYRALAEHLRAQPAEQPISRAEAIFLLNGVLERYAQSGSFLSAMTVWRDNLPGTWYYAAVQEAANTHLYIRQEDGTAGQDPCTEDWVAVLEQTT